MNIPLNQKELIAIEYPGTVQNVPKMVKQFGGLAKLSNTFNDPLKRLELHPRCEDPFSKPFHGDKFNTIAFMLEITKRKNRSTGEVTYNIKNHGSITTIYKFKSLCDFQVLPIDYDNDDQKPQSLLPKLLPLDLHLSDWLDEDVPLFISPVMFSRFDVPQSGYVETHKPKNPIKPVVPETNPKLISRSRPKRNTYTVFMTFDSRESCLAPREEVIAKIQLHPSEVAVKEKVVALFEERPVWTRNAILSKVQCDKPRLTFALTSTAYYFSNGPWRTLWVKFGYDPRKIPASKIYQIMDFRLGANIKIDESNRTRAMEFYTMPSKSAAQKGNLRIPMIQADHFANQDSSHQNKQEPTDEHPHYMLIPGRIPSTRQCYFQLCDILYDDVQKLIHKNDGREQFCHEKDGWCDIGVLDKCREIITRDIKETSKQLEQESMLES